MYGGLEKSSPSPSAKNRTQRPCRLPFRYSPRATWRPFASPWVQTASLPSAGLQSFLSCAIGRSVESTDFATGFAGASCSVGRAGAGGRALITKLGWGGAASTEAAATTSELYTPSASQRFRPVFTPAAFRYWGLCRTSMCGGERCPLPSSANWQGKRDSASCAVPCHSHPPLIHRRN